MIFRWMSVIASFVGTLTIAAGPSAADIGFDAAVTYRVPLGGAPALGPEDAPVTIVEFSDFYCPACNRVAVTLSDVMSLYPGKIRLVYRHNLLDPEDGTLAALAVMAAHAQGKFWPMHDLMFSSPEQKNRGTVEEFAEQIGLDMAKFRRALDSEADIATIREDLRVARELGVTSTPTLFVNGRPITGAQPLGVFVETIEQELDRAESMIMGGVDPGELYNALTSSGAPGAHAIADGADMPTGPALEPGRDYPVGLGLASHRRGKDNALVTIVEFSDFDCQYCRSSRSTLVELQKEFGADLRVVFRHKPLIAIGSTKLAAEAAVAAGAQGRFWQFHDLAFAHQRGLSRADLETIGRDIGLDMKQFRRALDDRLYLPEVIADAADAAALGVRGTPTFFVNGAPIIGSVPIEELRAVVSAKKKQAGALMASGIERDDIYAEIVSRAAGTPDEDAPEKVSDDPVDAHIAVLLACRANDKTRATAAFARVKDKRRQAFLRKDCKRLGIDLD